MKTNMNTTGTQDNDFNLFPPQVVNVPLEELQASLNTEGESDE